MLYDFINPSDPYLFEAESFEIACLAVLMMGNAYGCKELDGEKQFGPFAGIESFERKFNENAEKMLKERLIEVIRCLDSFLYASTEVEYREYQARIQTGETEEERYNIRKQHHDEKRSSMNDIGRHAWALASRLKGELPKEEGTQGLYVFYG